TTGKLHTSGVALTPDVCGSGGAPRFAPVCAGAFCACNCLSSTLYPQVSGSTVVWQGGDGNDSEIFLAIPCGQAGHLTCRQYLYNCRSSRR
ncbi:MAG: hypothetical protein ACYSVY_15370, partial [Planctomycetota bacterium]